MQKLLKLTGVSILAIMATASANAAGYTCEELIEYTSCNAGYYLSTTGAVPTSCPDGYTYGTGWCYYVGIDEYIISGVTEQGCAEEAQDYGAEEYDFIGDGCFNEELYYENYDKSQALVAQTSGVSGTANCIICPAGYSCAGDTAAAVQCAAGTYQPETQQTSCIDAPVGHYVSGVGATEYTACPSSGLTDANGNAVPVTTASTGSTSSSACYVAKGTEFKDDKGIYHFTEHCHTPYIFVKRDNVYCPSGYRELMGYDTGDPYCINRLPATETECLAVAGGAAWWDDEAEECVCDDFGFEYSTEEGLICRIL